MTLAGCGESADTEKEIKVSETAAAWTEIVPVTSSSEDELETANGAADSAVFMYNTTEMLIKGHKTGDHSTMYDADFQLTDDESQCAYYPIEMEEKALRFTSKEQLREYLRNTFTEDFLNEQGYLEKVDDDIAENDGALYFSSMCIMDDYFIISRTDNNIEVNDDGTYAFEAEITSEMGSDYGISTVTLVRKGDSFIIASINKA